MGREVIFILLNLNTFRIIVHLKEYSLSLVVLAKCYKDPTIISDIHEYMSYEH